MASGTPCESSVTVSRSGHRVAATRRRSSASSDSGKLTWNGRMAWSSAGMFVLLVAGDVDDGLGEGLRGFLRQVVPDAAGDGPVLVLAGELVPVGGGFRVRCAVGVTFEGDRRNGDDRTRGQPPFEIVVSFLAVGQAEPPAVVVDHDGDVVSVVEGRGAPVEIRVTECPSR